MAEPSADRGHRPCPLHHAGVFVNSGGAFLTSRNPWKGSPEEALAGWVLSWTLYYRAQRGPLFSTVLPLSLGDWYPLIPTILPSDRTWKLKPIFLESSQIWFW